MIHIVVNDIILRVFVGSTSVVASCSANTFDALLSKSFTSLFRVQNLVLNVTKLCLSDVI